MPALTARPAHDGDQEGPGRSCGGLLPAGACAGSGRDARLWRSVACALPLLAAFRSRRSPAAADVPVGAFKQSCILSKIVFSSSSFFAAFLLPVGAPAPRAIAISSMFIAAGS